MPSNNLKTGFVRNYSNQHDFTADRIYHSGEIIQVLGRIGIVSGERQAQIGDQVGVCFDRMVEVTKRDPATAFVKGDDVGYHDHTVAANPMTADAGGAGTFDIGMAVEDSPAGHPTVKVIFPYGS